MCRRLAGLHTLNVRNCVAIVDVSALGGVHTIHIAGCRNITDISALGRVYVTGWWYLNITKYPHDRDRDYWFFGPSRVTTRIQPYPDTSVMQMKINDRVVSLNENKGWRTYHLTVWSLVQNLFAVIFSWIGMIKCER
jgi:hypothetical protein